MFRRGGLAALVVMATTAAGAGSAHAAQVLSETVGAAGTSGSCTQKLLTSGSGFVQRSVDVAGTSAVTARLDGRARATGTSPLFDRETGRLVAGSSYSGTRRGRGAATSCVRRQLTVQACRRHGRRRQRRA